MGLFTPASRNRLRLRIAPFDLFWAVASPFAALALRDPSVFVLEHGDRGVDPVSVYLFVAIGGACAIVAILAFRLSDGMSRFFSAHDVMAIAAAVATSTGATSLLVFSLTRLDGIPRSTPMIHAMVLGGGLLLARVLHRVATTPPSLAAARPDQFRNTIIIGADRFAALAIKLMASQSPPTTRAVALLDENPRLLGRTINGVRIVGSGSDLEAVLAEYELHGVRIDRVLLSDRTNRFSRQALESIAEVCARHEIECRPLGEALNLTPKTVAATIAPSAAARRDFSVSAYFKVKRALDILASLALMPLLAPLAVLVAGLVLIDVGTPLLFWQERLGRHGRRFLLYKFRTFQAPYDWRGLPVAADRRLSRLGRFIRATRLDELPQLLNILTGDMSLIGPRPLLLKDQPDDASIRLAVRPGITGWAQVNGGNLVDPDEKEALDVWYIEHAAPFIDLKILAHTLIIALTGERFNRRAVAEALHWRGSRRTPQAAEGSDAIAEPGRAPLS